MTKRMACIVLLFCAATASISPAQTFTTLADFGDTTGLNPGPVVQGIDGNFYGVTTGGGNNGRGTAFRVTPSGMLTRLYEFCSQPNCADGDEPNGALTQGPDGYLYGITAEGGAYNSGGGTIFKMTLTGSIVTI